MSKDLKKENIQEETTKSTDESQSKWKIPRIRRLNIVFLIIGICAWVFLPPLLLSKERGDYVQRVMILLPSAGNIVAIPLVFLLYEIGISIMEYIKFYRGNYLKNKEGERKGTKWI